MGSGHTGPISTDLFSTPPREDAAVSPNPPIPTAERTATTARHVLPSDLPTAIKHLDDQELDQLFAAAIAERLQRGKKSPAPEKASNKRAVDAPAVSLTPGKLNAVRAAFKAGVTPSKIAKQFGIPQSDVRKVIVSEGMKKLTDP